MNRQLKIILAIVATGVLCSLTITSSRLKSARVEIVSLKDDVTYWQTNSDSWCDSSMYWLSNYLSLHESLPKLKEANTKLLKEKNELMVFFDAAVTLVDSKTVEINSLKETITKQRDQLMARGQTATVSQGSKHGIPASVYNSIATEAVRKWPNDYDMQVYEAEKQVEAYKKMNR